MVEGFVVHVFVAFHLLFMNVLSVLLYALAYSLLGFISLGLALSVYLYGISSSSKLWHPGEVEEGRCLIWESFYPSLLSKEKISCDMAGGAV